VCEVKSTVPLIFRPNLLDLLDHIAAGTTIAMRRNFDEGLYPPATIAMRRNFANPFPPMYASMKSVGLPRHNPAGDAFTQYRAGLTEDSPRYMLPWDMRLERDIAKMKKQLARESARMRKLRASVATTGRNPKAQPRIAVAQPRIAMLPNDLKGPRTALLHHIAGKDEANSTYKYKPLP
jgi:hypothetical protein